MKALLCSFALLLFLQTGAQRSCGFLAYKEMMLSKDPSLKSLFEGTDLRKQQQREGFTPVAARDTAANELIIVPVVVHILYKNADQNISDARVNSQMQSLNADFSFTNDNRKNIPGVFRKFATDSRIKFCLAQVDPWGKRTTGIVRKQTSKEVLHLMTV